MKKWNKATVVKKHQLANKIRCMTDGLFVFFTTTPLSEEWRGKMPQIFNHYPFSNGFHHFSIFYNPVATLSCSKFCSQMS